MSLKQQSTSNFMVVWDDSNSDDTQRAQAILTSCEPDLAELVKLIGPPGLNFSGNRRIRVLVGNVVTGDANDTPNGYQPNYAAANNGTAPGQTGLRIWIDYLHSRQGPAKAFARSVFIAELAEIVNAQWPGPGGLPVNSSLSEAISRAMSAELDPDTYYDDPQSLAWGTPMTWLNAVSPGPPPSRTNWVDNPAANETTAAATGCTLLFLFYLRYQLGYSWHEIMTAGGATPAQVYQRLTGRSDAWAAFNKVIEEHLPAAGFLANPAGPSLRGDNPFPLWPHDGPGMTRGASIALSDQYAAVPLTRFSESGFVKLKPCSWSTAAKLYSYLRVSRAQTTTVTFHYYGFAVPTFYDFHIRGLPPAPPNPLNPQATDWRTLWSGQQATAHARVGIENFAAPGTFAYHGQDITVSGAAPVFPAKPSYVPKVNGMSIAAPAGDGVFAIEFSVSAYEFYAPDKKTTIDGVIDFETLQLIMDSRYISDRVQCQAAFWKDASQYIPLPPFDFHPQPPEHPGWQEMLAWLAEARQGLAEHASRDGTAVRRIAKALAKQYSAPASLFLESDS